MRSRFARRTVLIFGGYAVAFVAVWAAQALGLPPTVVFVLAVVGLAGGAVAVGEATERLSRRLSPAATGVVQSVLGNLPELFLAIFALQAGLLEVVAAALVGSVLGNALFVLGLALLAGGLRHGRLTFSGAANRLYATELLLGVAALAVPFLATQPGAPDFGHDRELSAIVAIVLLGLFAASVPISLRLAEGAPGAKPHMPDDEEEVGQGAGHGIGPVAGVDVPAAVGSAGQGGSARAPAGAGVDGLTAAAPRTSSAGEAPPPPLRPTLALLGLSAASAAFVADWFVEALRPAMSTLGMSEAFAGLIVVALAGNAVENLAGVTAAARGHGDLSMSLILNSALQVVLFLAPVIVLLSFFVSPVPLTLILSPLLLGTLAVSVLLVFAIVTDGEANAFEGAMLLGLYAIIGAAVWWGPPITG